MGVVNALGNDPFARPDSGDVARFLRVFGHASGELLSKSSLPGLLRSAGAGWMLWQLCHRLRRAMPRLPQVQRPSEPSRLQPS